MRLLHRIMMILSISIMLCLALALISVNVITDQFTEVLLNREMDEKSAAIEKYIDITNQEFENRIYDNAIWDDLYFHLEAKNHTWIEDNCTRFLFEEEDFDIDMVYIQSQDNDYTEYYSTIGSKEWVERLSVYDQVLSSQGIVADYLFYEGHLIRILASKVKDNEETDSSGILILGRFMDDNIKQHLSDFVGKERVGGYRL